MRDIYATTMQLVHVGGGDAFAEACDRAMAWAWRVPDPRPDLIERPIGRLPDGAGDDEMSVEWWSVTEGSTRALELRLRHPDSRDASLLWKSTITISDIAGTTRSTVRVERGARVHILQPWRLDLRAPAIVSDLMRPPLLAYAGALELTPGPRVVAASQIDGFIADVLKADGRALPVLVASSTLKQNLEALAKGLAGLAQLVRLVDDGADTAFFHAMRKSGFTVPRGGLRLYWPGFGTQKLRHPYWTSSQIREDGRRDRSSLVKQLIKMLAETSAGRVPADPGVMQARRVWLMADMRRRRDREEAKRERARRERAKAAAAFEKVRAEARSGVEVEDSRLEIEHLEDELRAVRNELDDALGEAERARTEEQKVVDEALEISGRNDSLNREVVALQNEVDALRESVKQLSIYKDQSGAGAGAEEEAADTLPETITDWGEVDAHLDSLAGPGFALTDQACDCPSNTRYPHPDKMWKALRDLERVGRAYNEMGADLNMRFEDFALEHGGIEVALQDNSYGDEHWFDFEADTYSRLPHVKIDDAKAPNEVGRIYFALDPAHKRLIVDWFGTKPDRPNTKRSAHAAA